MPTQSKADLMQQIAEDAEEEAKKSGEEEGARRKFTEFECPTCSAYNPREPFGADEELRCNYCGLGFIAVVTDDGRLKLREE